MALRAVRGPRGAREKVSAALVGGADWTKHAREAASTSTSPTTPASASRTAKASVHASVASLPGAPAKVVLLPEQQRVLAKWLELARPRARRSANQADDDDVPPPTHDAAIPQTDERARAWRERFAAAHELCATAQSHLSAGQLKAALSAVAEAALYEDSLMLDGLVERSAVPAIFLEPGLNAAARAPCACPGDELAAAVAAQFEERVAAAVLRTKAARARMRGDRPDTAITMRLRAGARRAEARAATHADVEGEARLRSILLSLAAQIMRDAGDEPRRWGARLDAAIAIDPENVAARVQRGCAADLECSEVQLAKEGRAKSALVDAAREVQCLV